MVSQKTNSYPIATFPYQWLFEIKQQVEGLIYQLMGRHKESTAACQVAASLLELSPVSKDAVVGPWRAEDFAHICVL